MRKKVDPDEFAKLLDAFNETIVPWCKENNFSLHQAFEMSRASFPEKHHVLRNLWATEPGRAYLNSYFESRGGRLKE